MILAVWTWAMALSYCVWFSLRHAKEPSSHAAGHDTPESVCAVSRQPKENRGQKSWSWVLALTLCWKDQRTSSVKKVERITEQYENHTYYVRHLSVLALCCTVFALVWQIDSLALPPWRTCTSFASDYMEVRYVIQPSLEILVCIVWDLGPECNFE